MKIKLVRVIQTCPGAPSQWDAWDAEGRYYYLRYRHGRGSAEGFDDEHWYERDLDEYPEPTHYANYWQDPEGESWISLEDFCAKAGLELTDELVRNARSRESGEAARGSAGSDTLGG